ncbi:MAG: DsbA family protein, partial [Thermomicrobiales bacterium]
GKLSKVLEDASIDGMDLERFESDLDDRSLMVAIGEEFEHGKRTFGVFGTPTFVFPNGATAYLKMLPNAPKEDSLQVFREFVRTVRDNTLVREIKRPALAK